MARSKPRAKRPARSVAAPPREMLLVASKVRQQIHAAGFSTAADALDGLNAQVAALIDQAVRRAAANGRKTVRAHDF